MKGGVEEKKKHTCPGLRLEMGPQPGLQLRSEKPVPSEPPALLSETRGGP